MSLTAVLANVMALRFDRPATSCNRRRIELKSSARPIACLNSLSIREAVSMLRNQYPGRLTGALEASLSRRLPRAGPRIPLGMGQLLTVFARRD